MTPILIFLGVLFLRAALLMVTVMALSLPVWAVTKTLERLGWIREAAPAPTPR
jgi:hypothetical protein